MSAQNFHSREAMAEHGLERVTAVVRRHQRVRKLRGGKDTRRAVIHDAYLRLMSPGDPLKQLTPSLRRQLLKPVPYFANLTFCAAQSPRWQAFSKLHGMLFELSDFWEPSKAAYFRNRRGAPKQTRSEQQDKLIELAVDAARQEYKRETARVSRPSRGDSAELARHTEAGQQSADDPARLGEPIAEDSALTQIVDAADTLGAAESLHAPETEISEASERTLHLYSKLAGGRSGRKLFDEYELVTGNYRSGEWADPAKLAEIHQKWSRQYDMRKLSQESHAAGFDLAGTLQNLRAYVGRAEDEARARAKEVAALKHRMRRVRQLEQRTAAELAQMAELRAFAAPLARDVPHRVDLDSLLSGAIRSAPKRPEADLLAIFYANSEQEDVPKGEGAAP